MPAMRTVIYTLAALGMATSAMLRGGLRHGPSPWQALDTVVFFVCLGVITPLEERRGRPCGAQIQRYVLLFVGSMALTFVGYEQSRSGAMLLEWLSLILLGAGLTCVGAAAYSFGCTPDRGD